MTRKLNKGKNKQLDLGLQEQQTAIYIRVSTQLQADEGFSLEAQRERLQAYCVAQGWTVRADHVYVDAGVSGKTTDRPQFQAMLQAAQAGRIQRIVAMKLDRMARNVREFLATVDQLKAWHCDLVLVKESFDTSTPHGRFALTMFAAMAELEASTITERVLTGKGQKAKTGGFNGSPCPFGYQYSNGAFTVKPDEAVTVSAIFRRFLGGESMNAIATHLNAHGVPTQGRREGSKWFAMTVKQILLNGAYAGIAQWDGYEVKGAHTAIITPEMYETARTRLQVLRPGRQVESEIERRLREPEKFVA